MAAAPAHGAALVSFGPAAATWGGTGPTFSPISLAAPPNDPRVFVVQRGGAVRIAENGVVRPTPFLTVPGVDTSGERGLLSIAFPWDYASSGKFYVFASIGTGGAATQTRIIEYRVSAADPNVADPGSGRTVLTQPLTTANNHNGGGLAFGPDWRLYLTLGDNTNRDAAQSPASQLGKVLRIDPADPDGDGPLTYGVPADNPFAGSPVWALGFRNPFRAAFDPAGRLIIADVGEGTWEEVNVGVAGANYGWPACEGYACAPTAPAGLTTPFHVYNQDDPAPLGGCSVIGGVVVRDPRVTGLAGRYLFGDYCRRDLRTADLNVAGDVQLASLQVAGGFSIIGFGEDARGCAYALADGTVYRVANMAGDGLPCTLPYLTVPPNPQVVQPPSTTPPTSTPPAATPGPPAATPVPTTPKVVPKNCVRGGEISIRVAGNRRITSVRLVRGKKTKKLKLRRDGMRVELRGLPNRTVKLRVAYRGKGGRTVHTDKTYRVCKA